MARDGALHRDPLVREREVAWAQAWSEEFSTPRLAVLAAILVAACLISGLVFRPVVAAIAVLLESWLGFALFMAWRAARGIRRAAGP